MILKSLSKAGWVASLAAASLLLSLPANAGAQKQEKLSASVRAMLQRAVSDQAAPKLAFASQQEAEAWLDEESRER